jgi:glycosyltransferase involved in cell wall biosynthesis
MNVLIVNNGRSLNNIVIDDFKSNPGVGGTEFVCMQLLIDLSVKFKQHNFFLITEQKIIINKLPENCSIIDKNNIYQKIKSIKYVKIITTAADLLYLKSFDIDFGKIILWSHHPHDQILFENKDFIKKNNIKVVSIGEYQYHSNRLIVGEHFKILNLPPLLYPKIKNKKFNGEFVYLGGINPAKGLHIILENWRKFISVNREARLHVVGGDLYGENYSKNKKNISASSEKYAKKLSKILEKYKESEKEQVLFYGKVGSKEKEEILNKCSVALLNPTGKSEAYPASALECLSFGIPVIAGGDYGMLDIMLNFKGLDLLVKDNINMVKIIEKEIILEENYFVNSGKCIDFYDLFYSSKEGTLQRWANLIFNNEIKNDKNDKNELLSKKIKSKFYLRHYFMIFKFHIKKFLKS